MFDRYIARGPVTIAGRDWRSGEIFTAIPEQVEPYLSSGLADPVDPVGWVSSQGVTQQPSKEDIEPLLMDVEPLLIVASPTTRQRRP